MSEYTSNLQLFKYDTATDGKKVFSINDSMNDNWDKIDAFAAGIKSLSNLDEQGEKRFTDINAELNKKLEAEVLLAENGYIKFNNGMIACWHYIQNTNAFTHVIYPITFTKIPYNVQFCPGHKPETPFIPQRYLLNGFCGVDYVLPNSLNVWYKNANTTYTFGGFLFIVGH